jgi:hypothetical protein
LILDAIALCYEILRGECGVNILTQRGIDESLSTERGELEIHGLLYDILLKTAKILIVQGLEESGYCCAFFSQLNRC